MQYLNILEIVVPPRQRKVIEQEPLDDIVESICSRGLFHPLQVVEVENEEHRFELLTGERRLEAFYLIHASTREARFDGAPIPRFKVPCVIRKGDTELVRQEIEYEENAMRVDLPWQDRVAALAAIHQLKLESNPEQTLRETAEDITPPDKSIEAVRTEISRANIVAPLLGDPEVKNARHARDAYNIAMRKTRQALCKRLSAQAKQSLDGSEHKFISGDFNEILPGDLENKFSCIIADPPYGIRADQFDENDTPTARHEYDDSPELATLVATNIAKVGDIITPDQAHLYMFCDISQFENIKTFMLNSTNWKPFRTPLIWRKGSGLAPLHTLGFCRTYELILFANKGKKAFAKASNDIIDIPGVRNKRHAAQKPIALYETLLKWSTIPGDFVIDPCCGSGTIFRAAPGASVIAYGIDNDIRNASMCEAEIIKLEKGETDDD